MIVSVALNTLLISTFGAVALYLVWCVMKRGSRSVLNSILFGIDTVSTALGKAGSWCILILTFAMSYEVFARYLLQAPTEWAFDVSYILYGALFMLAGPYALTRNAHVRGDFAYRSWS
ncbi:MAG: TRAP transporter small permease subunit, partial [Bosea sp. (in: a-proteobacteria)]